MAKLAKTIAEARDLILKRLDVEGSSDYQTLVLEFLNLAITDISMFHDWRCLQKKATLTMPDATGTVTLPAECDRVLSIHQTGADYNLVLKDPNEFESIREDDDVTVPMFYCFDDMARDTDVDAPSLKIDILSVPDSGTQFNLWYIRHFDELQTADIDTVPFIPPQIWSLAIQKALLEALKFKEVPEHTVRSQERMLTLLLSQAKTKEKMGATRYDSFQERGIVKNWNRTKGRSR